jgi:hypothetical protein
MRLPGIWVTGPTVEALRTEAHPSTLNGSAVGHCSVDMVEIVDIVSVYGHMSIRL